ncbi:hypothetical protein [Brevibacillus parabrevis]|uniref:hypothetical protein n=1 Tax=Brevibacillus parabrevis TaxID=54914 RepID=UPI001C20FECA|nr:hypothetical protein [Brevibacillus parabrevis]MBU8713634.1 hypothetical protein [Brevibacillus parabrevis]MED2256131.1 hypothetical protein [Brevibacillus parabrevis]WDV94998.1 hypothetical protein PSE45_25740 [Brevibacillus parabrevis]
MIAEWLVRNSVIPAQPLSGVVFSDATGQANDGKTSVALPAVSVPGNSFVYKLSADSNAVPTPNIGDSTIGWTPVTNGSTITATHGQHIGVAEVGIDGKVVKFVDNTAVVIDYIDAVAATVTATDAPVLTTNLSGKMAFILVTVDGASYTADLATWDGSGDADALKAAIEAATTGSVTLDTVANVTVDGNGKIVITSKTAGATSTVAVTFTGLDAADAKALTGFDGSETNQGTNASN